MAPVSVQRARKVKAQTMWATTLASTPTGTALEPGGTPNATAAGLEEQWSYFGAPGQESEYGSPDVVTCASAGIPNPPNSSETKVIKLHHAAGDPAVHHKLYKDFTAINWPKGTEPTVSTQVSPANLSGRYVTYIYAKSSEFTMTQHNWVNTIQFKEAIYLPGFNQDPSWWAGVSTGGPFTYTMDMACEGGAHSGPAYNFGSYLDSWMKWEMRLYQGVKMEWWLNDTLMDTGLQSEYPVGRLCQVGNTYNGSTITACGAFTFGAGLYCSDQVQSGAGNNEPDYTYNDTTYYVGPAYLQAI